MKYQKWFFNQYLKHFQDKRESGGFTLIELLVALILAALVITPLLGFMITIMDNDRKEQAKATSEQEIKAALDYIARDLEQAIYIYDADGIAAIRSQLPKNDQQTNYFPVLVFWKRQYIPKAISVGTGASAGYDDTYVYSLVAYYLIKGDNADNIWSKTARIGRFQLSDGYGKTTADVTSTRDPGFQIFDPNNLYTTLRDKMNNWTKDASATNTPSILPLVDYIDQTTVSDNSAVSPRNCPTGMQQVPNYASGATGASVPDTNLKTGSFYVCVQSTAKITVAEVHLRGNAYARIENNENQIKYSENKKIYFPEFSTQVKGRGFLFTK
ncbi:prepilin-type N-terminal cleavage/methylation domain-containing protein [Nostoc sp. CENA67]|uniref:Prepilin-type N-terminal cleavage/methylation domain-containing protein n=1 Tax=Amazonocrinis nigriterrae CENA67 TaxID=2794033 RepID=A0A8J7HQ25_9NOST|nr:hormogonium polysaccharide secretion pseudopilin HpsC [Amazonocrinis nigriterrae]MBH8563848.1 prepilin-type N-terminal cleavage/methylation domain-containing protein [Amazonocrinis nigriterrae CENA67]